MGIKWSTNNKLGTKKVWKDTTDKNLKLILQHKSVMKRARKVSNVHGDVHFKQKQRLTIVLLEIHSPTESSPVTVQ